VVVGALVLGAATVALTGALVLAPTLTVLGLLGLVVFAGVVVHPPLAAYLLIGSTPLIVGIDRESLVPLLRPNEAVLLLLGGALITRGLIRVWTGARLQRRLTRVDGALLGLIVTTCVLPLAWLSIRGKAMTSDDFLYSLTLVKYYSVFLIVRAGIRTDQHVRRCLWASMGAAAVVATIAVLQSLKLFGVPEMLANTYAQFGSNAGLDINRGSSTLANAVATGDVMAFNLAIALAWLARGGQPRRLLQAASALFVFGGLASGEFSAVIALVAVVVTVGALTHTLTRKLGGMVAMGGVAGLALQPVIARRLADRSSSSALPSSWADRLHNLQHYFWPKLFSHYNFVLGVRPSPRIATPAFHTGYVWIESGHTWLLWTGGIPLLVAFVVFMWVTLRATVHVARTRADATGAAAMATFAALVVIAILMTFDPHLTLRGAADLLFSLLALTFAGVAHGAGLHLEVPGPGDTERVVAGATPTQDLAGRPAPATGAAARLRRA